MTEKDFRDFRGSIVTSKKVCSDVMKEIQEGNLRSQERTLITLLEVLINRQNKTEEILSKLIFESLTKDDLK